MNSTDQDLEQQLRAHYQQEMGEPSPSSTLWYNLAGCLPAQQQTVTRWQRLLQAFSPGSSFVRSAPRPAPVRRLIFAGSFVCALLLVFGIVYAAGSFWSHSIWTTVNPSVSSADRDALLLTQLLNDNSKTPQSLQHLAQTGQFTNLRLTKTAGSSTVTLQKVYADSNYIVIGYTLDKHIDRNALPTLHDPSVTLPDGQMLRASGGQIWPGSRSTAVLSYIDATSIQGNPQQLNLHIMIPAGETAVSFDQTVPFHASKVINVNETVTSDNHAITLERAVIAPSSTRLFFKDARIADIFTLSASGKTYSPAIRATSEPFYIEFWDDLHNRTGTWILKIDSSKGGQFTFTFTVS